MLRGWIIDQKQQTFHQIETEDLQEWREDKHHPWQPKEPGRLLWIDLSDPQETDFDLLARRMELHATVVANLRQIEGRPKIHQYEKYFHLTAYALKQQASTKEKLQLHEIDFLVGDNYVITMHQGKMDSWESLIQHWKTSPPRQESGAAYLVYELLDGIMDEYFPLLDGISDELDELEDILFQGNSKTVSAEIFSLKRQLIRIRRVAAPMREVVGQLMRHYADDKNSTHVFFQDLYDHVMRVIDLLDSCRDILSGAMDVYLAAESNRMNAVMKTLTSYSIIFLFPTLLAGVYGMNFEVLPELHYRWSYFIVLGVMVVSMLGLYGYFKRKGWL